MAVAADKRDAQLQEISAIKEELKPLRERAYVEPEVIAARRKLDAAYREYWESVRGAMERLDPAKKKLIKKEIALRKETGAVAGGSRAEDYEKKAAQAKAAETPSSKAKKPGD